jgi:hypothetical protein
VGQEKVHKSQEMDFVVYIVAALDSLPNGARAMLSAAVLAVFLYLISTRITPYYLGLHTSFRKSSLLALVVIPVFVYYVLDLRILILVATLPDIEPASNLIWWPVLGIWLAGVVFQLVQLARSHLANKPVDLGEVDRAIEKRLAYWAGKLSVRRKVRLGIGSGEGPHTSGWLAPVLSIPPASLRWSAPVRDVMMIHQLCLVKRDCRLWNGIGAIVAAIYWPIPWVKTLALNLNTTLEQSVHTMARSCFNDDLSYDRAFKQIGEHLAPQPDPDPSEAGVELDRRHLERTSSMRAKYVLETLRRDPKYDRVFWALVPAALAVFILTNTTLAEIRDRPNLIEFGPSWSLSFTYDGLYRADEDARRDEKTKK